MQSVDDERLHRGLTVGQTSQVTGVSSHTLRYWERAGLMRPVERTESGQRRYRASDVEWIRFLLRLKATGMSHTAIRQYAELFTQGDATIPERLKLLNEQQDTLAEQFATLNAYQEALDTTIASYQAKADPTPTET